MEEKEAMITANKVWEREVQIGLSDDHGSEAF